jgi:hypothetical protein
MRERERTVRDDVHHHLLASHPLSHINTSVSLPNLTNCCCRAPHCHTTTTTVTIIITTMLRIIAQSLPMARSIVAGRRSMVLSALPQVRPTLIRALASSTAASSTTSTSETQAPKQGSLSAKTDEEIVDMVFYGELRHHNLERALDLDFNRAVNIRRKGLGMEL